MSKKTFRKLFLIFILLCVVALLFLHSDWTKRQYDKGLSAFYVYRGDRAYKKRDLQGAINYYSLALDLYPEHYEARYNLGNIYVVYEDYNDAVDSYKIALEDKPDFNVARMNLGIVTAEKLGNFDEAIADYQQIINNQPRLFSIPFLFSNRKSAKLNRGIAYYNMGVAYRQKAIYEDSNDSLKRSQNLQNAVDSYMSASKILKKDFDTFYNMAIAYHLLGNYQEAGKTYCKAISINPMSYEAHYNLAILLKHLKMYKESVGELEKANILVHNDDSNMSVYVFDVLNDVSRIMVNYDQYDDLVESLGEERVSLAQSVSYVHGKVVATKDLDKAMLKNFSTCSTEAFFEKE